MFFLTVCYPHSVSKNKVVQNSKRQPPDSHSRREGLYHMSASKCEHLWPGVDGTICPSQHFIRDVPKDMTRGQSSRVFFSIVQWFLITLLPNLISCPTFKVAQPPQKKNHTQKTTHTKTNHT